MAAEIEYLDLADFLLIAEAVLGEPVERLAELPRIGLADSALAAPAAQFDGQIAYPDLETKVAVLGAHLIKNHPLPDGNKRAAFLAMIEFAARNGSEWKRAGGDPEETDRVIRAVAASEISVDEFREWVAGRISRGLGS